MAADEVNAQLRSYKIDIDAVCYAEKQYAAIEKALAEGNKKLAATLASSGTATQKLALQMHGLATNASQASKDSGTLDRARPWLAKAFGLDSETAGKYLRYWMEHSDSAMPRKGAR